MHNHQGSRLPNMRLSPPLNLQGFHLIFERTHDGHNSIWPFSFRIFLGKTPSSHNAWIQCITEFFQLTITKIHATSIRNIHCLYILEYRIRTYMRMHCRSTSDRQTYHSVWYRHNIPKLATYNLCRGKKVPAKKNHKIEWIFDFLSHHTR